jgi:hypothetical protein
MTAHRNRPVVIGAALLLSAIAELATPRAAEAIVPVVTYVTVTTFSDSTSPKRVAAPCPFGWSVLGGGAVVTGAQGEIAIQAAFPIFDAGLGQYLFVVKATEDINGTAAAWSLTAAAYCTSTTVATIVHEESLFDSEPIKSTTVECPNGLKVVGMGGEVSRVMSSDPANVIDTVPDTGVVFRGVEANDDLTHVTARATEYSGALGGAFAGSWKVVAVAACAQPAYFDGLELRKNREIGGGLLISEDESRLEIACSANTKRNIAAAASIDDHDLGQWYLDRLSRYNAFHTRIVGESYRNSGIGMVRHAVQTICVDK